MLRHSVMWLLRDTTSPELRTEMLAGLAFLRMECPTVRGGDYGEDIFGGSRGLSELDPSERLPVWRRGCVGPPSNYDVAFHLDFDDWEGHDAYGDDPNHEAGSKFNETVAWDELTARVDWHFDGQLTRRGHLKHFAMLVWADESSQSARDDALQAVERLADVPDVEAVALGQNVGRLKTDYDWVFDITLPDRAAAERLLASARYAAAMETVAAATKYEWTARLTHVMRRP